MRLYQAIAQTWQARENCEGQATTEGFRACRTEWHRRHTERIYKLCKEHLPRGSGFDNGTTLDFGATRPNRLVFNTAFHHMNDVGMYDGWSEHQVIVTPSLAMDFDVRVTGRDRNDIKGYILEVFNHALLEDVPGE